jgi:hypothetical protein
MKISEHHYTAQERELLDNCIAWHVRPHRQAFLDALCAVSPSFDFNHINVLELSASGRSMLSPFLVAKGANAMVTCYRERELQEIHKSLTRLCDRYGLNRENFQTAQMDVFAPDKSQKYDLILMKDCFGGYNRQHNHAVFREVLGNCLSMLNADGNLLIIDKGRSLKITHWLHQRYGQAGSAGWHYFSRDELNQLIPEGFAEISFSAYGIFSFADFKGKTFQRLADFLDEHFVEKLITVDKRAVFSTCYARTRERELERIT